jgi:hypothetical protein
MVVAPLSIINPHPGNAVLLTISYTSRGERYADKASRMYLVPNIPVEKWPEGPFLTAFANESFAALISSGGIIP